MDKGTKQFASAMIVLALGVLAAIYASNAEAQSQQRIRITWTEVTEDLQGNKIPPGQLTYNSYGAKGNTPIVPVATNIKGTDHIVTLGEGCYTIYITAYRADKGIESEPSNVESFCTDQMELETEIPEVDTSGFAPRIPALTVEKLYE